MSDDDWEKDDFVPPPVAADAPAAKEEKAPWADEDKEVPTGLAAMTKEELIKLVEKTQHELEAAKKAAAADKVDKGGAKATKRLIKAKQEELDARRRPEADLSKLSAAELYAQKIAQQEAVIASDLDNARALFGEAADSIAPVGQADTIDSMDPQDPAGFDLLANAISKKVLLYETVAGFEPFLETLVRDMCQAGDAECIRRIINSLNVIFNEKQKSTKPQTKKTNKKKGAQLARSRDNDYDDYIDDQVGGEYDDFM